MATFWATNTDGYQVSTGTMPGFTGPAVTVTWWIKLFDNPATFQTNWSSRNPAYTRYLEATTDTDGVTPTLLQSTGTDPVLAPMEVGLWYRLAVTNTADTGSNSTITLYRGEGDVGALTSDSATMFGLADVSTLYIGGSAGIPNEYLHGSMANFKQYDAVLTTPEIEAEWASWAAVRTLSLVRHYKFIVPETTDYSGNGHTLTAGSTEPTIDPENPPIPGLTEVEEVQNSKKVRGMIRGVVSSG